MNILLLSTVTEKMLMMHLFDGKLSHDLFALRAAENEMNRLGWTAKQNMFNSVFLQVSQTHIPRVFVCSAC